MTGIRTTIAALFAIAATCGAAGASSETLTVPIGSIFEIQAATESDATINWVLTQGEEFIESSNEQVFRTRFSREGTYMLMGQVQRGSAKTERVFTLNVHTRNTEDVLPANGPSGIVSIEPIAISASQQVITMTPVRTDVKVLALDLDTTVDSNGDGNPNNDEDTRNTLFRSERNPLRIWFVDGVDRTIRFGALLNDGNTVFSNMQVSAAPEPEPSPIQNAADMKVLVLRSDNGEVQYALRMEREQSEPVLLQWDFGDGNQSLLDRPIHLYAESGNYTVTVEVRSLRNGEIIGKASDELMVNRMQEVEPDQSQTNETTKSEGGSLFGLIGKLLLSIVFFGALGAAIMFIVSKIKEKGFSLEKTMEMAEQTIVKPPSPEPSADLPPMEIAVEEVEVPVEPPAPEPEPEPEASTPDWLQAGLQSAQETETSHAPDWLQAGMEKVEEQESTLETPAVPEDTSAEKEDAAREKKRRKRQRYRENVKKRKEEEEETEVVEGAEGAEVADANEPIAFIKAEDIEPLNPADDQKPA